MKWKHIHKNFFSMEIRELLEEFAKKHTLTGVEPVRSAGEAGDLMVVCHRRGCIFLPMASHLPHLEIHHALEWWTWLQKTYGLAPQLGEGDGFAGAQEWVEIPRYMLPREDWGVGVSVDPWNVPGDILFTIEEGTPSPEVLPRTVPDSILNAISAFTGYVPVTTGEPHWASWGEDQYLVPIETVRHLLTGDTRGFFKSPREEASA